MLVTVMLPNWLSGKESACQCRLCSMCIYHIYTHTYIYTCIHTHTHTLTYICSMCIDICVCTLPWWPRWYRIHLPCVRPGFNPWVGKIPWRRAWQPTPVSMLEIPHGQRSLAGYNPQGHRVRHDWATKHRTQHIHMCVCVYTCIKLIYTSK